jgi:hypothetical protein
MRCARDVYFFEQRDGIDNNIRESHAQLESVVFDRVVEKVF